MPLRSDLRRHVLRRLAACSVAATGAVGLAGVWAATTPVAGELPASPHTTSVDTSLSVHRPPLYPPTWAVSLWRPFADSQQAPVQAAPLTIKLFSVLRQGDGMTAAFDPGNGSGLVYARIGQQVGSVTVTAITDRSVEVEVGGRRQRLELAP